MGGMTIMHLADSRPELIEERVRGVVLVSTSMGDLAELDLGLPRPFGRLVRVVGRRAARAIASLEPWVNPEGNVPPELWLIARHVNFGKGAAARLVDETLAVARATPLDVVAAFYQALMAHDGRSGVERLAGKPVSIVVGDQDRLTPPQHSLRMKSALPSARVVMVPDAGHMVLLERPETVTGEILAHVLTGSSDTQVGVALPLAAGQ
jgi:pimeloyl-ACP methyl ester carboxylesterase